MPERRRQEQASIQAALSAVSELGASELAERYAMPFQPAPSYDVTNVQGLSTIQGSALSLSAAELAALGEKGFVITDQISPTFLYGYAHIYSADLPVYVSVDSILYSIHDSYDDILQHLESGVLSRELAALLSGMRARLSEIEAGEARGDADVYLTVAASLLGGTSLRPAAGGDPALVAELYQKANAAQGMQQITLFGVARDEDFSQFEPRGHYTDSEELKRYFRAMMWLGRTDFRMLETQPDGNRVFRRRQVEAALVLRELVDDALRERFDRIDETITAFVGEHDYMRLAELDSLVADLGVSSRAELSAIEDAQIVAAIVEGGYGAQRISSHIMYNGLSEAGTLPLSASFAFLGQRYVLDSHVFSNVVYDRVAKGSVKRMLPNPLDAAFAALGNDQAVSLLSEELERYPYAADLASMRVLADAHPESFWSGNLYNLWLSAVRTLSPDAQALTQPDSGLFPAARSELWGRRMLNAQLASWAELRHDTILYAKQSYTGGIACEFPDAYLDPYPEFYAKVGEYATRGKDLVSRLGLAAGAADTSRVLGYFDSLATVAARLKEMAEYQRTGAEFTAEMMEFINDAVTVESICGGAELTNLGWYGKLFFNPDAALEFDPTIADVHTQPTDEAGNPVGRVLHVGTGGARKMVVIAEGCSGPRAYVGLSSSYYEKITENFERLTDQEWKQQVSAAPDPTWVAPLITR
ncbi:MAG TPA: DUF3160 domain-containing protein [Polyangiaceae bacterium]